MVASGHGTGKSALVVWIILGTVDELGPGLGAQLVFGVGGDDAAHAGRRGWPPADDARAPSFAYPVQRHDCAEERQFEEKLVQLRRYVR